MFVSLTVLAVAVWAVAGMIVRVGPGHTVAARAQVAAPHVVRAVPVTAYKPVARPAPAPKPAPTTTTRPAPTTTSTTRPAPTTTTTRPPAPPTAAAHAVVAAAPVTAPPTTAPSGYGCGPALAYLAANSAPGFHFECPGYADGHQAMTCINEPGLCPGTSLIAISVPCPAAYMNEAHNSWVLAGLRPGSIDPYGYCH